MNDRAYIEHLPWRGPAYGSEPKRILLLGDSHYVTDSRDDSPDLTQAIVRSVRDGRRSLPFFSKVVSLFEESAYEADSRQAFWDRVAFLNYVPVVVGQNHDAKPTRAMWQSGAPRFFRVLDELRPTHVLSLGRRQWNEIRFPPGWISEEARGCGDEIRRWRSPEGPVIAATSINHPSSRAFSVAKWRSRVRALLDCPLA